MEGAGGGFPGRRPDARHAVTHIGPRSDNLARQATPQAEQIQRLERAEADAARLAGELEDVKQRLAQRTIELRTAERQLAETRRAGQADKLLIRELLGKETGAAEDHLRMESVIAELQARRTALEAELAGIAVSTSWKVTGPARRVGMKYPAFARTTRRLLKVMWWSLRLDLISRLREVSRRRRN